MTFAVADRVWETSTTTGTGSFTLAGAVTGYRTFSSVLATYDPTYFCITDGTNWEVCSGELTGSTLLNRRFVLSSSNGGALVNFPAGTKQVFITQPASRAVIAPANDTNNGGVNTTENPPLTLASTPYWYWETIVACVPSTKYYGFRVASNIAPGGASEISAYSHETEYDYSSGLAFGYRSSPTTVSSLASAGSATFYGFYANAVAPNAGGFRFASTTYSFYANSSIGGSNNFQFYANGTDPSVFVGPIRGVSSILSSSTSAGVGYRTGAGSTQTQSTNKSTGVTLNNICGQITMNGAALGATTSVSFTFTNSTIAATDVVIVNIASPATTNTYLLTVDAVATGSCRIHLRNISATSRSEALVLNFAVIKAVAA